MEKKKASTNTQQSKVEHEQLKTSSKRPSPKSKSVLSVSPSAWMVWEKCALSLQNVKSTFQLERDEYAKAGTALHKAISDTLILGKAVALENDDDAALVRFAVDTAHSEVSEHLFIEERITAVVNGVDFSGTADIISFFNDTVIVIDFKTGWREVEAEGNSQLKIYAHAAVGLDKKIKRWKGIIINARFNSVSYTGGNIEPDYLSKTAKDILDRTKKSSTRQAIIAHTASAFQHVQKSVTRLLRGQSPVQLIVSQGSQKDWLRRCAWQNPQKSFLRQ